LGRGIYTYTVSLIRHISLLCISFQTISLILTANPRVNCPQRNFHHQRAHVTGQRSSGFTIYPCPSPIYEMTMLAQTDPDIVIISEPTFLLTIHRNRLISNSLRQNYWQHLPPYRLLPGGGNITLGCYQPCL